MSADNETEKNKETAETLSAGNAPQVSEMIDKILANPELISMVASAFGGVKPSASGGGDDKNSEGNEGEAITASADPQASDIMSAIAPVLTAMQKTQGSAKPNPSNDRRTCLLVALKPYLCRERCEAIDYMVKLGRLSEVFKTLS